MSAQGENVAMATMAAGLVGFLIAGLAAFGAPLAVLVAPLPLLVLCFGAVRKDLRHVRRHGWNTGRAGDDPDGEGGGGGPARPDPAPPAPSGEGEQFDWDAFVTQFWEHVDRQPVPTGSGAHHASRPVALSGG